MEFRILGPLQVLDEGREVTLGGSRPRALLALLLVHANEALSTDRLIEELWDDQPPAAPAKTLQVHISRLRKALTGGPGKGSGVELVTRERGYELRLDPSCVDAHRLEQLAADGRSELAAGRPAAAAAALEEGLALWRGRPLDDLAYASFAQAEIARLDDLRAAVFQQLIDAKLELGRHAEVIGPLEALIAEHPYREHLRAQLMLALYRCDRQADALQAYQEARRTLVEELGIEPGDRLRRLESAILAQDPELALPVPMPTGPEPEPVAPEPEPARADPPEAGPPARRLVSIVFADLAGSTGLGERLDPESMHALLDRYVDVCGSVIERHGGTVEGFIGDAVVGVFGLAELHEDDGLRALRAAVEMRDASAALSAELERDRGVGIAIKFGVESGEVFLGGGARRPAFAAGDAFNVAARLEGLAPEGEILLGENLHRLVRGTVRAERLGELALKGRTAKVQAWRLLELDPDSSAIPRGSAGEFVGREWELDELRAALARAQDERLCRAVTVVGPAGIGKSRLTQELIAEIDGDATVVVGRCPSYGEGVTYRPLAEIVGQLGRDDPRGRVRELLDGDDSTAQLVLAAAGLSEGAAQAPETFWAVRMLLERVASDRALVMVFEDIHWAEPTLLDLLEHLIAFSTGQPILLLCLARPELLESRPAWLAPQPNRAVLTLDPLPDSDALRLIEGAGGGEFESHTAAQIVETAEGNPLFLEHLVAVRTASGEDALPSTIQAVLAARIDSLSPGERTVLEHASVQGRSFFAGALGELLADGDPARTTTHLVALVQKQLIVAERSELPGEDAFRFSHVLIREAAYRGLPKLRRAELHEQVAHWIDARPGAEHETVGHHLGEAFRHRADLGPVGERERALALAAADRLAAAAEAALLRGDPSAGAHLLENARSLLEFDGAAADELLPALGAALFEAGRMADATRVLDEAISRAPEGRLRARAQVERELVRLETETDVGTEQARPAADAAMRVLEDEGDDYGQCRGWLLRGQLRWNAGQVAAAEEAWRAAADCAERAGAERALYEVVGWRALAAALGPTPVTDAIRRCEKLRVLVRASPVATASTLNPLALLYAMQGDFEVADRLLVEAGEILRELGGLGSGVSHLEAFVRLLAGEPARVEARLRDDVNTLSAMNGGSALATTTALLAQVVYARGQLDEAGELCRMTERRAAAEDSVTQATWRGVWARIAARDGRCQEAETAARAAVAVLEPTDLLSHRGDAMLDLADVLHNCDRPQESEHAIREAIALYDRKGNAVAGARARSLLSHPTGGT